MPVAVAGHFVTKFCRILNQLRKFLRHPPQKEECRPHLVLCQNFKETPNIAADARRHAVPVAAAHYRSHGFSVEVIFYVNRERVHGLRHWQVAIGGWCPWSVVCLRGFWVTGFS